MGSIKRFDLDRLRKLGKTPFFFETGTWKGDGLAYAAKYDFEKLFSSEIIEKIANAAKKRFENSGNVEIIQNSSIEALKEKIPTLNGNCIFWLDAHFPGAEEGLNDYNEFEEDLKLPLELELQIIAARTNTYEDIILIDDLRIYEDGAFKNGNLPANIIPPHIRNIQFAYNLFGNTHEILKFYSDEGYIAILPKRIFRNISPVSFFQKISNKMRKKML